MKDSTIVRLEQIKHDLAKATDFKYVLELRDQAEAIKQYVRSSDEIKAIAAEATVRASRRLGELLAVEISHKGGRPSNKQSNDTTVLADMGISKDESSRWQIIAKLPEGEFEKHIANTKEVTTTGVLREARTYLKRKSRADKRGVIERITTFNGKYRVLYADPPWKYHDGIREHGEAAKHYNTMSEDELCDLTDTNGIPVRDISCDNAVLFLWVTTPKIFECYPVMAAWGFEYKTLFTWDKVRHNLGYYNSVRQEFLLLGTKGSCRPDANAMLDSVVSLERSNTHSEKPEHFREMIDSMYLRPPGLPVEENDRIELFARKRVLGWDVFGNDIASSEPLCGKRGAA